MSIEATPDDHTYRCRRCNRVYHVTAGDPELSACLADDCRGPLAPLDFIEFAREFPELVPEDVARDAQTIAALRAQAAASE
jgi:hypothetical protein